jgi:two-component system cell cycle sensor histidine kinase/response regulator CckA
LPSWTGLEALKVLRAIGNEIPFLLVTGTLGEEAAVECIKQGVSDYILKEHISRLPMALKRAIEENRQRSENIQVHAALAESEAHMRRQFAELELIYRTAPIGLGVYGPDLRYMRVNEELARINGFPAEKHAGHLTREFNPDIADVTEPYLRTVLTSGESISNVEVEGTTRAQPGVRRNWLASFHPLRGSDGGIFGVSVVVQEITEQKRTEKELELTELRNRDLVENSVYGIFRASMDGAFLDGNPALLRILGCSAEEELKTLNLVRDIFRYPEQYAQFLATCRDRGQVHGAETEWRRRDGGIVAVRLHLRRISIAGHPDSLEVMAEDVTEFRAMEKQLRQAQKFEAIGQLAGGVAHDFNNVVGAILGWAELGYEQNKSSPQLAERFTRIREQAERAAALTRELLAFARRQVLQPRAVELNEVTSGLLSFLEKVIPKDIEIKVTTAKLDTIKADPTQIEQVLMNLCLNARDAMPSGGRLHIETEMVELDDAYCRFYPQVSPGPYAVLSVSDTGMGMDAETREHMFEPFFTTKGPGKGTGMGLATVYGVVKQHGGFIHAYSEPGQGTLFRVYLPATNAEVADCPAARTPMISLAEMHGTETILIAEDHESIREMARQTLLSFGYRVLSACDGEEALQLCENETPALAILDVVMPKLGGPAAAVKLGECFANLPVLFTSGYSQDADAVAKATKNARYLQKPYSPTMLGRLVREILDEAKAKKAAG